MSSSAKRMKVGNDWSKRVPSRFKWIHRLFITVPLFIGSAIGLYKILVYFFPVGNPETFYDFIINMILFTGFVGVVTIIVLLSADPRIKQLELRYADEKAFVELFIYQIILSVISIIVLIGSLIFNPAEFFSAFL